ncbi:hypothetical protein C8J56DRAFT_1053994 [Mycena floridula]|nr:hypothetical protein C8J56DRAFT_1053994 [Mycena floridula]
MESVAASEVSSFQLVTGYSIRKLDLQDLVKVSVQPPVPVSFEGNFSVNSDLGYYESPRTLQVTTRLHDPKKVSSSHMQRTPTFLWVLRQMFMATDVTLPNANQLRDLSMELEGRTLAFGHSLWQLVDNYTDKALFNKGYTKDTAPISIPSFHYVDAATLIKAVKFRKYMGNGNAKRPPRMADDEDNKRAEYLMYAQHIQYLKTGKLAFAADFQGDDQWLTDPQIITHPNLGAIFTRGNIPPRNWSEIKGILDEDAIKGSQVIDVDAEETPEPGPYFYHYSSQYALDNFMLSQL